MPRYIQRCVRNPFRTESPYLGYCWLRGTHFESLNRAPKACGSNKCPSPVCRKYASNQLYSRFLAALQAVRDPAAIIFAVLTLPSASHRFGRTVKAAYEELHAKRTLFLKNLRYWLDHEFGGNFGNANLWAIEEHASRMPHCNVILVHRELADLLRGQQEGLRVLGLSDREAIRFRGEVRRLADVAGLGLVGSMEPNRFASGEEGLEKLAGYAAKCAGAMELQTAAGEQQKQSQNPLNSPYRRRRWNAGKGFVPGKHKNETYTGAVISRRISAEGDEEALSLLSDEIKPSKTLARALTLPEGDPRRQSAELEWEAKQASGREHRRMASILAQVEQELSFADERLRAEKLSSNVCERMSFRVHDGNIYTLDGRLLAREDTSKPAPQWIDPLPAGPADSEGEPVRKQRKRSKQVVAVHGRPRKA